MMGRCNVFDFSLRFMLAAMWNNDSRWDMSQLDHAGLGGISPAGAVTFLDNPDTDLSFPVIWNKLLGYAYILMAEGYPCARACTTRTTPPITGATGSSRPSAIDNLIWIHENLAANHVRCRHPILALPASAPASSASARSPRRDLGRGAG
jgi:hypothetical protein